MGEEIGDGAEILGKRLWGGLRERERRKDDATLRNEAEEELVCKAKPQRSRRMARGEGGEWRSRQVIFTIKLKFTRQNKIG